MASSSTTTSNPKSNNNNDDQEQPELCLICYDRLRYPTLTPCGHDGICATCHLRLRYLVGDNHCPICKTSDNEQLIVVSVADIRRTQKASFEDYSIWGNELGSDFLYREDVGMFFPKQYYESTIASLFSYQCLHCKDFDGSTPDRNMYEEYEAQQQQQGTKKKKKPSPADGGAAAAAVTPLRALEDHLRVRHRLQLCSLCVEHKRDFIKCLPRYSVQGLKRHYQHKQHGHPECQFCAPQRFYDLPHLYQHLQRDHYRCDVCDRLGVPNQYFRNYHHLERHFDQQHYLCHDVQCLQARFVVFDNEIDLRAHEIAVHGRRGNTSTKIQLQFQYRRPGGQSSSSHHQQQSVPTDDDFRFGLDGATAFVPESLPQQPGQPQPPPQQQQLQEPDVQTMHPLHLQRTNEIRAAAAAIRQRQGLEAAPEAFPTLGGNINSHSSSSSSGGPSDPSSSSSALRMGWTSEATRNRIQGNAAGRRIRANDQEAFPSLPTSTTANKKKKKKNGGGAGRRPTVNAQFSSMQAAANVPAPPAPPQVASSSRGSSGSGWASTAAAAAAASASALTPSSVPTVRHPPPTSNFPSLGGTRSNQQSNLTAHNFPSLASSTNNNANPSSRPYAAVDEWVSTQKNNKGGSAVAMTNRQSNLSSSNFPSLGGGSVSAMTVLSKQPPMKKKKSPLVVAAAAAFAVPRTDSSDHFPGLPSASSSKKSIRAKVVGNSLQRKKSGGTLLATSSSSSSSWGHNSSSSSVSEIKAVLGNAQYKELKTAARDFGDGVMTPEAFVDYAASQFPDGYGDGHFWQFLPTMIATTITDGMKQYEAMRYMEEMKTAAAQHASLLSLDQPPAQHTLGMLKKPPASIAAAAATAATAPSSSRSWGGSPATTTYGSASVPVAGMRSMTLGTASTVTRGGGGTVSSINRVNNKASSGTTATAWGANGNNKNNINIKDSIQGKPGSVTSMGFGGGGGGGGGSGGTATKFMAKEQQKAKKQQQQQQQSTTSSGGKKKNGSNNNNKSNKQKKKKDELRALAGFK